MKQTFFLVLLVVLCACAQEKPVSSFNKENWNKRSVALDTDSLNLGSSYLSIYSEIYERNEEGTHLLASTVSMRNISSEDTLYILKASYYDTKGSLIRTYFDNPVYLLPMETVEIVIDKNDRYGGTGANFIFDWASPRASIEPFFEAVMISTSSQQGISFTTQGIRRK
ncbi:MAG: DUF3124 domain-containing protein [Cyclobacteriaceae bacterium]